MVDSSSNHRYHCCCGCHVHNLTIAIAIIGILLNIGASIGNYKTGTYGYYTVGVVGSLCYILLIVGNITRIRYLYWPYFVVITFVIIGMFILSVLFFILAAGIAGGRVTVSDVDGYDLHDVKIVAIILGVVFIVVAVIQIMFMVIVYRDYCYIRDLHHTPARVVAAPVVYAQQAPVVYAQQAPTGYAQQIPASVPESVHVVRVPSRSRHSSCCSD